MQKKKKTKTKSSSLSSSKGKKKRNFDELSKEEQADIRKKKRAKLAKKKSMERAEQEEKERQNVLKQRKKVRRKKRLKRLFTPKKIVLFLIFIALSVGLVFLVRSEMFNITKIEVTGQNLASTESILKKSGIEEGQNMFSFSAGDSQDAIEEIIFVKDVRIDRKYPDTIIINVEERTPLYILESDKNYYEIDSDGVVLLKSDTLLRSDVPVVSGINLKKVQVGNKIHEGNDNKLKTLNRVFDLLMENDLLKDVSQFYVNKNGTYYLYLKKGSILEFSNFSAFNSHIDFVKYFFNNEDLKVKVELIEGINPIYKKVK